MLRMAISQDMSVSEIDNYIYIYIHIKTTAKRNDVGYNFSVPTY